MKLLLLGGNGQVGRELRRSLPALGQVVVATRDGVDADAVADFDAPDTLVDLVQRIAPDVVVNAAAYTAVDQAESEPDAAFRANALGPAALAQGCTAAGALLGLEVELLETMAGRIRRRGNANRENSLV